MKAPRFELYQDDAGEWRWRLVSSNGRVIADSGEGYVRRAGVEKALERLRDLPQLSQIAITEARL